MSEAQTQTKIPEDLRYTKDHEWVRVKGAAAVVGITDYAQHELGDIVFVDLPEEGKALTKGNPACVVESVKSVSDVYAPADGAVAKANEDLGGAPELVNNDPYGKGWLYEMSLSDASQLDDLMDAAAYRAHIGA